MQWRLSIARQRRPGRPDLAKEERHVPRIEMKRVVDVLQRVARRELPAKSRHDGACRWVIEADGLAIEIFDDAGEVDYVECVTDEAGRQRDFNSFCNQYGGDPIDAISAVDRAALEQMMERDLWDRRLAETKTKR